MASVPSTSSHGTPSSLAATAERLSISQEKHDPVDFQTERQISPAEGTASASDASSSNHTGSDESSVASQQTDATNMHSDAQIEAGPARTSGASARQEKTEAQSRRSSEGDPLASAPEGAGQMEEYPTPSGALLPPPEGERSVLAAVSGSTIKVRRGVSEEGAEPSIADAEEASRSVPMESEGTKSTNAAGGTTSAAVGALKADDHAENDPSLGSVRATTSDEQSHSVASGSLLQRSTSGHGKSEDSTRRSSVSAQEASSPSTHNPLSPSASQHQGHQAQASTSSHLPEEGQHTPGPSSDVRPADFEGASFVPIKVKDFAFSESDPRHVGARDVSLGAPSSKGHPFIHRKPREEDWDETDADSSGLSLGNQGRWRGGAGDDWGPGVSYDEDEEEFEGDHGRRGSGGSGQEKYDTEVEEGEAGIQPGLYEVIYDFAAESEHELSVTTGDRVRVVASVDGGWAVGIREGDGKEGLVPEGYLVWIAA